MLRSASLTHSLPRTTAPPITEVLRLTGLRAQRGNRRPWNRPDRGRRNRGDPWRFEAGEIKDVVADRHLATGIALRAVPSPGTGCVRAASHSNDTDSQQKSGEWLHRSSPFRFRLMALSRGPFRPYQEALTMRQPASLSILSAGQAQCIQGWHGSPRSCRVAPSAALRQL